MLIAIAAATICRIDGSYTDLLIQAHFRGKMTRDRGNKTNHVHQTNFTTRNRMNNAPKEGKRSYACSKESRWCVCIHKHTVGTTIVDSFGTADARNYFKKAIYAFKNLSVQSLFFRIYPRYQLKSALNGFNSYVQENLQGTDLHKSKPIFFFCIALPERKLKQFHYY